MEYLALPETGGKQKPLRERSSVLEVDEKREKILTHAAAMILNKIIAAAEATKEALLDPKEDTLKKARLIRAAMRGLWPENNGDIKPEYKLGALAPAFRDIVVKIEPLATGGSYSRKDRRVTVGLGTLLAATTEAEFLEAVDWLQDIVYHEVEHIDFHEEGHMPIERDEEDTVKYLTSPCEIRAHAKQFATRYKRCLPNQPFDPEKMIQIASKFTRGAELFYFNSMKDPAIQARYPHLPLSMIRQQMIELCTQLLDTLEDQHP